MSWSNDSTWSNDWVAWYPSCLLWAPYVLDRQDWPGEAARLGDWGHTQSAGTTEIETVLWRSVTTGGGCLAWTSLSLRPEWELTGWRTVLLSWRPSPTRMQSVARGPQLTLPPSCSSEYVRYEWAYMESIFKPSDSQRRPVMTTFCPIKSFPSSFRQFFQGSPQVTSLHVFIGLGKLGY